MRALAVVYLSLVLVPRAFAGPPGRCVNGSGSGCHTNSPSLDACDNGDDSCDGDDDDDDDSCDSGDDDDSCSGDDDSDCDVARHHGHAHRHHPLRSELAWASLPIPFALVIWRRSRARKRR